MFKIKKKKLKNLQGINIDINLINYILKNKRN